MPPIYPSLFIDTPPTKTTYYYGELFDPTGMVVKARKKGDTIITITNYRWSPTLPLTHNDTTITIDANGYSSVTQAITVLPILVSISIDTPPTKTTYTEGEYFDTTGMVVKANYSDGTSETITGYTISNTGPLSVIDTTIVISYQGKTANQAITVLFVLSFISIQTPPTKTTYLDGEYFDPTGMVVQAYYLNHGAAIITNYSILNPGPLGLNDSYVTISFRNATALQAITVLPVLTSISIDTAPYKTVYTYDDYFEPYGMVVKAHYSDGSSETITDYTFSPTAPLEALDTQITISYQGKTATQMITMINPLTTGFIPTQNLKNAEVGNNPYFNLFDQSIRFISDVISVSRDSYTLPFNLVYHSRMPVMITDKVKGLPKRFKSNYHRYLIQDGTDDNDGPFYKYIDEYGYIHTFSRITYELYYAKESNLYLHLYTEDNVNYAKIIDTNNNQLVFNNDNGHFVKIIDGFDSTNIKRIVYNGDNVEEVYDARDDNARLIFNYTNNLLTSINFTYLNATVKSLLFNYDNDGFLISLQETANNDTRTLYNFYYNNGSSSFDRLQMIEDCLNSIVYKANYSFNSNYHDFITSSLSSGYFDSNHQYHERESIETINSIIRDDGSETPLEISLTNQNDINYVYHLDRNAQITASFTYETNQNSLKTTYKESGVCININGDKPVSINGHSFKATPVNGLLFSLTNLTIEYYFPFVKHFVLRLYARINYDGQNRVMAILTSPDIVSKVVDLNVDQYAGYQLVEIPFTINDNASDITLTLRFDNEFEDRVSVDIADLYIDKSTQTTLLFYNGQKSFNELEKLKLYSYPETTPREYNTLRFPNFSEQDLLNTLWLKNVHPELNPNYGNIVHLGASKDFGFFKTWFKGFDGSNNLIFDSDHLTNSDLESSDCWYFLTKSPNENSITKTYYRYITENNIKYLEIITNNCSEEGTNNYAVIQSEIKRYLCNGGKLIKTTKTVDIGDDNPKTSITDYEYFTNGELKKVQTSSGEEIIVLYEASQNSAGYVSRKTSGLNSVDVTYDNYLEKTITQNQVNGSTISHSLYTKTINYDSYLGRVFSNNFNYNNHLNVSNKCQVYYQDNVMYFSNNIHSLYALEHNVSENKMYFKRFNGQNHENVILLAKDNISSSLTYYDSSNIVINNNYDACGKQINQSLNNDTKVIFTYENNIESPTVAHISSVLDKYLDPSGKSTTMTYHHSGGSLKQLNFDNSSFVVSIDELNIETDYTIGSNLTIQVNRFYDWIDYRIININMFSRSFSNERDAYQRIIKTFYDTSLFDWLYAEYSYLTSTSLVSSYAFGFYHTSGGTPYEPYYQESYSYDRYGNLSTISNSFSQNYATYSYDGFNRLTAETNASNASYNRSYYYDNDGRMSYFGSVHLSYNDNGQLEYFGNTCLTYDHYGNRLTKGDEYYTYVRGKYLATFTKNSVTTSFTYDYLGRRYQKTRNNLTTTYYYHDNKLIAEERSNGITLVYLYNGDDIAGFYKCESNTESIYYYVKNPFGVIVGIIDEHRSLEARYVYDAWGNHIIYNSSNQIVDPTASSSQDCIGVINPIRYKGYYFDQETGLYYLKARYYDPSVAQFISPDDYSYLDLDNISGYHLYAYCNYNPVMYSDENGQFSLPNWMKWLFGGLAFAGAAALTALTGGSLIPLMVGMGISAVGSGVVGGFSSLVNGGNFWQGFNDSFADGVFWGGLLTLGSTILNIAMMARQGYVIGKNDYYRFYARLHGKNYYNGMKSYGFIKKHFGENVASKLGWIQNKFVLKTVMFFHGPIFNLVGPLTGIYAKEVELILAVGYKYFYDVYF